MSEWDNFMRNVIPGSPQDRIIGMIYGHALGDAVGLQCEFKFKCKDVEIKFPYDKPIRDYPLGDWTDDTDHLILVMQSLLGNKMKYNAQDFAKRLKFWSSSGFPELGDTTGLGLGGTTNMVIIHPKFLENPILAAKEVWTNAGRRIAPNGSLMRTSVIGSIPNLELIPGLAADLSRITHPDPRCIAACVFQSIAIHNLIYNSLVDIDDLMDICIDTSLPYITGTSACTAEEVERRVRGVPRSYIDQRFTDHGDEFLHWIDISYTSDISALELDESVKIGFVLKCLGCSVFALQMIHLAKKSNSQISFKKFIILLAREAGDADTNCAVAGATLGAYLGYSKLPIDWISALPNRDWLNKIIMNFISLL